MYSIMRLYIHDPRDTGKSKNILFLNVFKTLLREVKTEQKAQILFGKKDFHFLIIAYLYFFYFMQRKIQFCLLFSF